MTPRAEPRRRAMTLADIRMRTEVARAYLDVAALVAEEDDGTAYLTHDRVVVMLRHATQLVDALDARA